MSEASVQQDIRLAASRRNAYLWRNNSGAFQDERGNWIRYGLANDSKRLNEELKSSDLIGFTPVVITPDMVGKVVAIFTAIEVKPGGWNGVRSAREKAQDRFIQLVRAFGARAGFAASVEDACNVMEGK